MSQTESEILLDECRELMTCRISSSLSKMMGNMENALFELAAGDHGEPDGTHYIDAIRELRMKKREIQVRFENRFTGIYYDKIRHLLSAGLSQDDSEGQSSDIRDMDAHSAPDISILDEPIENTRNECRAALFTLDRHVNTLFEDSGAGQASNPLQPDSIFNAFWESCHDIRCGQDIRLILVQMFERQIVSDLVSIYDDINMLIDFYQVKGRASGVQNTSGTGDLLSDDGDEAYLRNSLLVRSWVQHQLRQRIAGRELPEFIDRFVMHYWSQLLEDIFEKYSIKSMAWDRAIHVVDDLVNCTLLTEDREAKTKLIWRFPGLVYRLKAGMKTISLPLNIQAKFLSELKVFHSQLTDLNMNKDCHS